MTRTLLALSLIAATPIATAAIGTPRVTAQAPATSIELDILQKARLGTPHAEVAATLWRNMLAACDDRDGVLAEYHDGAKRTQFDTREGAVRQRAYATCRLLDGAQDLVIGNTRVPAVTAVLGNGMPPTPGLVEATGPLRAAYDAVTVHIHKACADAGRRVRFASFAFGAPRVGGETKVEARFSCNSAVGASSYVD
ncbi:hypothetical protein [Luteibacter yeojuensis]|uniref:Uncharacterized protein n=1 Tax=Luteibacter yeojuensis TaxID=345309 RepID=A0A0F3L280_9GAMM|nr:hypothetical protein [Luteibacter yeojuensis]KJV36469.1 hypothetical protein VI08_04950 [Luteibacter yeojuensis]